MDLLAFLTEYQDHLAPRLDTYEQAIYLYIFRHSRLIGQDEVVIGFKSVRHRMATGVGEKGKPMADKTCYEKIRSLQAKGCIVILTTERNGSRIRLLLPCEIPGVVVLNDTESPVVSLEDMDFFSVEANRTLILLRESSKCFYCLRKLTTENQVIEHVTSRPIGNNSYRNVVAACRQCNNRKNDSDVEDFLRVLFRESYLSETEFGRVRSAEYRSGVALSSESPSYFAVVGSSVVS